MPAAPLDVILPSRRRQLEQAGEVAFDVFGIGLREVGFRIEFGVATLEIGELHLAHDLREDQVHLQLAAIEGVGLNVLGALIKLSVPAPCLRIATLPAATPPEMPLSNIAVSPVSTVKVRSTPPSVAVRLAVILRRVTQMRLRR